MLLVAFATIYHFEISIGCETTLLYGELDEEVYMKQLKGIVMKGKENKVYTC